MRLQQNNAAIKYPGKIYDINISIFYLFFFSCGARSFAFIEADIFCFSPTVLNRHCWNVALLHCSLPLRVLKHLGSSHLYLFRSLQYVYRRAWTLFGPKIFIWVDDPNPGPQDHIKKSGCKQIHQTFRKLWIEHECKVIVHHFQK